MSESQEYVLAPLFGKAMVDLIAHTPHAKHLGMRVVETAPRTAVLVLPYRAEFVGDPRRRVVFGGAITTLLDHASGLAVACAMTELRAIATVDLRVDYLRAAVPDRDLYARAECYRTTKNVAFVRGVAYEEDPADSFASCLATFMLGPGNIGGAYARALEEHRKGGER